MNCCRTRRAPWMLWIGLAWLSAVALPPASWAQEPAAEPACPAAAEYWQLRLVWLVDGLADDAARVPPPDVTIPVQALSALGITNLTMAAQFVVQAAENEEFHITGSAKVDEPCDVAVTGILFGRRCAGAGGDAADAVRLQIALVARTTLDDAPRSVCELRTTVRAPLDRPVVLGITPVQSKPSVILLVVTSGAGAPAPAVDKPAE